MKKSIKVMIYDLINQAKKEGFEGIEIEMLMRAYDITNELINGLTDDGYDVIYSDYDKDKAPLLLISWNY